MRLIDADKINFEDVFGGKSEFAQDIIGACQNLIDRQPKVEAVTVPCNVGDTVYVSLSILPTDRMDLEEEKREYLPARVVSFRKNSKGTFVKVAVNALWLHEWLDPEVGEDSAFYEVEKMFSYPASAFGKTIFGEVK